MTQKSGRQEQVRLINDINLWEINEALSTINRLFDGILGRTTQTVTPQFVYSKIVTSVPTISQLNEGELVLCSANNRLYTKIGTTLYYVNLTAV